MVSLSTSMYVPSSRWCVVRVPCLLVPFRFFVMVRGRSCGEVVLVVRVFFLVIANDVDLVLVVVFVARHLAWRSVLHFISVPRVLVLVPSCSARCTGTWRGAARLMVFSPSLFVTWLYLVVGDVVEWVVVVLFLCLWILRWRIAPWSVRAVSLRRADLR